MHEWHSESATYDLRLEEWENLENKTSDNFALVTLIAAFIFYSDWFCQLSFPLSNLRWQNATKTFYFF